MRQHSAPEATLVGRIGLNFNIQIPQQRMFKSATFKLVPDWRSGVEKEGWVIAVHPGLECHPLTMGQCQNSLLYKVRSIRVDNQCHSAKAVTVRFFGVLRQVSWLTHLTEEGS